MASSDGFKGGLELGIGLDAVQFRGLDERSDACPPSRAAPPTSSMPSRSGRTTGRRRRPREHARWTSPPEPSTSPLRPGACGFRGLFLPPSHIAPTLRPGAFSAAIPRLSSLPGNKQRGQPCWRSPCLRLRVRAAGMAFPADLFQALHPDRPE